jgi:hypothetical protein
MGRLIRIPITRKSVYMQVCACLIALDSQKFAKTLRDWDYFIATKLRDQN